MSRLRVPATIGTTSNRTVYRTPGPKPGGTLRLLTGAGCRLFDLTCKRVASRGRRLGWRELRDVHALALEFNGGKPRDARTITEILLRLCISREELCELCDEAGVPLDWLDDAV